MIAPIAAQASTDMPKARYGETPPDDHDYVDPLPEVAARWGTSIDSIKRAAQRGELRLTKLGPRRIGLRRSEGRRYLDSHTA